MTLRDYLKIAQRWWWLVLVGCVLSAVAAFLVSSRVTEVYQARAVLLVNPGEGSGTNQYENQLLSQNLTRTYAQLVSGNTHLNRVNAAMGDTTVKKLEESVSARAVPDTSLIEIFARDRSPVRAAFIANTLS